MEETIPHPQPCPCCQHVQEWMASFPRMVTELWSQFAQQLVSVIEVKVEKAVEKSVHSSCSNCCRSVLDDAKSSASRTLKLHFTGTLLDELTTLDYIKQEGAPLKVELQDRSGSRVELGRESSVKIKIFVLDGDFEVVDRDDWTAEEFKKNVAEPRKDKGPLLKGKCEILMKNGVAVVNDIAFTDNSKTVTKNGWFRLGAQVVGGLPKGVEVREAVSKAFQVKERRGKFYRRHKTLSLKDSPDCLRHVGKTLGQRLLDANIHTVQDFLQLYHSDVKALQDILRLPENKWSELIKNAESCPLPQKVYTYCDETSGVKLVLDCAFNIKAVESDEKVLSLYDALDDSQKELVNEMRRNAYERRNQLQESHTPINMTPKQAEFESSSSIPHPNEQHPDATVGDVLTNSIRPPVVNPGVSMDTENQDICGEEEGLLHPNSPGHNVEVDYMMMSSYHQVLASSELQLPIDQSQDLFPYQSFDSHFFSTVEMQDLGDLLGSVNMPSEENQIMSPQSMVGELGYSYQVQGSNEPFNSGLIGSSQKRPRHC